MSEATAHAIDSRERDAILNSVVADYAHAGWTISSVFAGQAIAQRRKFLFGTSLWVNVLIWFVVIVCSLATAGLFLLVLGVMYLNRGTEIVVIAVDAEGKVHEG